MPYVILVVAAAFIGFRLWQRSRGRSASPWLLTLIRRARTRARAGAGARSGGSPGRSERGPQGPVRLVAAREIRERLRSRSLKVGTVIVLLVVAAGVVIPKLRSSSTSAERIGVVGELSAPLRQSVLALGAELGTTLTLTTEPSEQQADQDLRAGRIDLALVDAERLVVEHPPSSTGTDLVSVLSRTVALQRGLEQAGMAPEKAAALAHPTPLPVFSLEPSQHHNGTERVTTTYGLILIFILLTQYGTWILMGVVEEKSSRVVEVLLSAIRTPQMLIGKVLGIGTVALGQGILLVAVALGLAAAVGSDLVKGAAPVDVVAILVWLVLGYAFYCWVYAAAGALAERQEHVQALAFPLQIPILFGYIVSLTSLPSDNPSTFIHVLAYLPPTAPFAMPVLVAASRVVWWQVAISAVISLVATVGVARVATGVYSRAILRTGRRIRLGEVLRASQG